jgi:uncharacterized protein (DUF885 family)
VASINDIADTYIDEIAALDPIAATGIGIVGHDDQLTDYTTAGFAARADLSRRTLSALAAVDPADERERVAKEAMVERLSLAVERYDAGDFTSAVSVLADPLHELRSTFDLMASDTEEARQAIATRLAGVPGALADWRQTLLDAARRGYVASRRQILAVAGQCDTWVDPQGDNFYPGFVAKVEADDAMRADLVRYAEAANAATASFGAFLRDELAPLGRAKDGVGREAYQRASRDFLGATVDLAETYEWGWQEVARLRAEMIEVARRIVPDGGVADAIAALDADPKRRIQGSDAFRGWMQRKADEAIAELHGKHFDIPEPVRRIECMIAPTSDGAIYYTGPSEDFSRPGRMWWSVPKGVDALSTWRETTTVYHEGVPGHHLQIAQTMYRAELLNRWQRTACWVSGHGEGWALYAERLMADLGYLDDPGDRLGMLDGQLFRAARVVVDIGMHLELEIPAGTGFHEGERWTPELGLEFLRTNCSMADEFVKFELERYLGWPGQAPSYKVGERMWLQARDEVKARKGADFDLASFHRDALNLGSIGLDPLRAALARL